MFGDKFARRVARRYRRRGLGATEQRMVDAVVSLGIQDATVLEIGGGVGELHLELLRAGAGRATNLELVDAYDDHARRLAAEAGLAGRIDRRILDIAAHPNEVVPADVVVLHRVVCCYPDVDRLLGAAADHANRVLVFSHPPRHLGTRAYFRVQNTVLGLVGKTYRSFVHSPAGMLEVLRVHGLQPVYEHHGLAWHVVVLERAVR
jgi:magnesium-protoporphyrin O-methyltransferase